jgi:hypothetical protein
MLSFYLLPALATTLKIRKRKLAQTSTAGGSSTLVALNSVSDTTKSFIIGFNANTHT